MQHKFNYSQEFLNIGYKEYPANPDGSHKLDKNSFHIWPREYMLIALTNLDGSFTCTVYMLKEEFFASRNRKM
jgi:kynurenine 3-monooxygenase